MSTVAFSITIDFDVTNSDFRANVRQLDNSGAFENLVFRAPWTARLLLSSSFLRTS